MSQGKQLFTWFNCTGCHANGGGGSGPPLMDDNWIYGGSIENIVATIREGRPNGMPSFRGRIPDDQIWEIAAYVRSMGGNVPATRRRAATTTCIRIRPRTGRRRARPCPAGPCRPPGKRRSEARRCGDVCHTGFEWCVGLDGLSRLAQIRARSRKRRRSRRHISCARIWLFAAAGCSARRLGRW